MKIIKTKIKKVARISFGRQSVKDIAFQLGVSKQTVWNWKKGKSFPTPNNLKRLEELGF